MQIFKVGGCVRDELMGVTPHDVDFCVVGATIDEMLKKGFKQVGKAFPVFLHPETGDEFALARTERKVGNKHTDFEFDFNDKITLEEDLIRRDFTVNAIAKDEDGNIIDPFHGVDDIENRILRVVNPETFIQDPLRVLRCCRFCAQLGFNIEINTLQLCRTMVENGMLQHLTPERIGQEVIKALKTNHFEFFIEALRWTKALDVIFPEIKKLIDVEENVTHHPERTTFDHTLLVVKEASKLKLDEKVVFGCLFHDIGKLLTPKSEIPKHHGHDKAGIAMIEPIMNRIRMPKEFINMAELICKFHMKLKRVDEMKLTTVFDLVDELTHFKDFSLLFNLFMATKADLLGRLKPVSEKNLNHIENGLKRCIIIFNLLKDVKADNFPELHGLKGEAFGRRLRECKIQFLRRNGVC